MSNFKRDVQRGLAFVGFVFGTISIMMLTQEGFQFGWIAPLQTVMNAFDVLFGVFLWPVEKLGLLIKDWLGLEIPIIENWRAITILLFTGFLPALFLAVQNLVLNFFRYEQTKPISNVIVVAGLAVLTLVVGFGLIEIEAPENATPEMMLYLERRQWMFELRTKFLTPATLFMLLLIGLIGILTPLDEPALSPDRGPAFLEVDIIRHLRRVLAMLVVAFIVITTNVYAPSLVPNG